ncbi:MAG: SMC-Scp complex subunit ScpB [Anaerovoracaceae bacterium]
MTTKKSMKSAIESMLFTWGGLLDVKACADVLDIEWKEAYDILVELQEEYEQEGRGILIRRVEKSFQFVTNGANSEYVKRLCTPVKKRKLSQSAMEVLAIVAYRQPVTRGEIESIRGIKCEKVLEGLSNKKLIMEVGRSSAIGRPILYGTTNEFLQYFNFESIKDLPEINDFDDMYDEEEISKLDYQQITLDNMNQ